MKLPDRPSDPEVAADVEAWIKRGGAITRLPKGKSHKRPLPYDFSHDGPLIEEPRRGGSGRKE